MPAASSGGAIRRLRPTITSHFEGDDARANVLAGAAAGHQRTSMASLDTVSIGILLGALLVLAGILSSLVAMRFGAPLLLVFLILGMLAGESGPGGIKFDDVRAAYLVGSIALALILFDGGLRTRFATFRSVFAPALVLATIGVLLTAALTAPAARYVLDLGWIEALLVGAVVASTDAAAVFLPGPCPRIAPAAARRRDPGGRIRQQRSVRGLPHHRADRVPAAGRPARGSTCSARSRCRRSSAALWASSAAARWCSRSTGSDWRRACTRRSWPPARW